MRALLVLLMFASFVHADDDAGGGFAPQKNFIGLGSRWNIGFGQSFSYGRRLGDRLILGTSVSFVQDNKTSEGGSLDTAQYFRDEYSFKMYSIELDATFYFRESGPVRWGPLVRGGIGHAHSTAKGWWGRYDRDPAVIIIGDDKRLLESHEDNKAWDSTYLRVGGYYQFAFNVHETARVSHILELGAGVTYSDSRRTISYTKSNGEYFSKDISSFNPVVEINYSLAF